MESGIILDGRRLKAFEAILQLGSYAGKTEDWTVRLWEDIVTDEGLMKEFFYYLEHHTMLDEMKFSGYSLTDLYVWQMDRYNLIRDSGRNLEGCNKEAMVLNAFRTMVELKRNPQVYVKRITEGRGMDQLF